MRRAHLITGLLLLVFILSACTAAPDLNKSIDSMEKDLNVQNIYGGTCARGNADCAYPGTCGQYIDENGDDYCDR